MAGEPKSPGGSPFSSEFSAEFGSGLSGSPIFLADDGGKPILTDDGKILLTDRGEGLMLVGDPLPGIPEPETPEVPGGAEELLSWITTPDRLEFVLQTLQENYVKRAKRVGIRRAKNWYRWQVARTLGDTLLQLVLRLIGVGGITAVLKKLGLF